MEHPKVDIPRPGLSLRERRQRTENLVQHCDPRGAWRDVDEGECERCGTLRRLYQPADETTGRTTFELRVCAPCTQVLSKSTLTMKSRDVEDDDVEQPAVEVPAATHRQPRRSERLTIIAALARAS